MNVIYHVNKQEQITKLEQKWWVIFNTLYDIMNKYDSHETNQMLKMPEVIQLRFEIQEIKDKIAKLK